MCFRFVYASSTTLGTTIWLSRFAGAFISASSTLIGSPSISSRHTYAHRLALDIFAPHVVDCVGVRARLHVGNVYCRELFKISQYLAELLGKLSLFLFGQFYAREFRNIVYVDFA